MKFKTTIEINYNDIDQLIEAMKELKIQHFEKDITIQNVGYEIDINHFKNEVPQGEKRMIKGQMVHVYQSKINN